MQIESIDFDSNTDTICVDEIEVDILARNLAEEFLPNIEAYKGIEKFREILINPYNNYGISKLDGELVGIYTFSKYPWSRIENQLQLKASFYNGKIESISLEKFKNLTLTNTGRIDNPDFAIEFGYNWVHPRYRGLGIGRKQWDRRMDYIKNKFNNSIYFTLSRSIYSGLGIDQPLINYLIMKEKQAQDLSSNAEVVVRGISINIDEIQKYLEIEGLNELSFESGSKPTNHFASNSGFKPAGFSRNFSLIWSY